MTTGLELGANALAAGVGVVLIVWVGERVLARAPATLRHSLWRLALAAFWLAPLLVVALHHWRVEAYTLEVPVLPQAEAHRPVEVAKASPQPTPAEERSGQRPAEAPVPATSSEPTPPVATAETSPAPDLAAPPAAPPPPGLPVATMPVTGEPVAGPHASASWQNPRALLAGLWLLGVLIGIAGLARDARLARRLGRGARPVAESSLAEQIARRCAEMGLREPPATLESDRVSVPTVVGWPRSVVLVPPMFAETGGASEAALVHELAHVCRWDVTAQLAARLTQALCWWHPLAWLIAARMAATAEEACDDWAVALTGRPREYAAALVTWAETSGAAGGLGCSGRGRALVNRVQRLLRCEGLPTVRLTARTKAILGVCALAAALAVGLVRMRAVAAEPDSGTPPGPGEVVATVVGPDGKPVEGAQAWLIQLRPTPQDQWGKLSVVGTAQSDAEGRFRFIDVEAPPGEHRGRLPMVLCHKPGLALGWRIVYETGMRLEIPLVEPRTVHGSLTTDDGRPIPGARALLTGATITRTASDGSQTQEYLPLPDDLQETFAATTDEAGAFELTTLPPAAWASLVLRVPGYLPIDATLDADDEALALRLGKPVQLRGQVTCPVPAEVAGRTVRVYGSVGGSATHSGPGGFRVSTKTSTDARGRFTVDGLPPGEYTLCISVGKTGQRQFPGTKPLVIPASAGTVDLSLPLVPAWPVTGRVVDARSGNPIPGAHVMADHVEHQTETEGVTHASGGYMLYALPGKVKVGYRPPEGYTRVGRADHAVNVVAGRTTTVPQFECKPGVAVTGLVVDEQGRPVAGASVWEEGADRFQAEPRVRTDAEGRFTIRNLPDGSPLTLYASHGDTVTAKVTRITVGKQTGPAKLVLSSKAASFVRGRVVDQTGQPVASAQVRLLHTIRGWTGPYADAKLDESGEFRSPVLIPGYRYTVVIRADGHAPGPRREFAAEPGKTIDLGDIVLFAATGTLAGVVVDSAGKPVPKVMVFNAGDGPQRVSTRTDDRGRFTLIGLFEGPAYALVDAPGFRFSGARATTGAKDLRIVLPAVSEPRPNRPVEPPTLTDEQYRAFAERAATEGLELTRGTEPWERPALIATLVRANPQKGLKAWQDAGWVEHDYIVANLVHALAETAPDEALYYASRVSDPDGQASEFREVGARLAKTRPDLAARALRSAVTAARRDTNRHRGMASIADTAYEMSKLGLPEAGKLLDEALAVARRLARDEYGGKYRASVAAAICTRNLPAAMDLVLPAPSDYSGHLSSAMQRIAYRTAVRDAAAAEDVLSRVRDGWGRDQATAFVVYPIARRDRAHALRLARTIQNPQQRALALGNVALAVSPSDKDLAFGLIDEAVKAAAGRDMAYDYNYGPGPTFGELARLALEIGYPDMQGLVLRALSSRQPWDDPDYYIVGNPPGDDATMAALVSGIDAQAARHVAEGAFARMQQAGGSAIYGMDMALRAAAVIDPEWALQLVATFPVELSQATPGHLTRATGYFVVADALSHVQAGKRPAASYVFSRMPDPEAD